MVVSCHTSTQIIHGSTCVPHPEPPPISFPIPSCGLSQCTSFECPASCIQLVLVIYFTYGNIHVSVLFSQIIPPSSSTESKCLFYTSVSLLLSCIQDYHYYLSKFHIYALLYCIGVFLSGLLHCIIGSSFIHLIRTDSNVFFLMAESYSIVYMYHSFLMHSSADGHLDWFLLLLLSRFSLVRLCATP